MTADAYDEPPSAIREHIDDLATWIGIWTHHTEPDAHARRCASDAVDAVDVALRELHQIRQRLVGEIRQADDATAARADELLRRRDDPPAPKTTARPAVPARKQRGHEPPEREITILMDTINTSADTTRREMIASGQPAADLTADSGQRWTTDELRAEFEVIGFAAPFVAVKRRSDGQRGSLEFVHSPRVYFGFVPDDVR